MWALDGIRGTALLQERWQNAYASNPIRDASDRRRSSTRNRATYSGSGGTNAHVPCMPKKQKADRTDTCQIRKLHGCESDYVLECSQ
jgi:hypothetical protein